VSPEHGDCRHNMAERNRYKPACNKVYSRYTVQMNSHKNPGKASIPVFKSNRLLDQLREQILFLHCSLRTEEAYV